MTDRASPPPRFPGPPGPVLLPDLNCGSDVGARGVGAHEDPRPVVPLQPRHPASTGTVPPPVPPSVPRRRDGATFRHPVARPSPAPRTGDGRHGLLAAVPRVVVEQAIRSHRQVRAAGGRLVTIGLPVLPLAGTGTVPVPVLFPVDLTQRLHNRRCEHALAEFTRGLAEATSVRDVAATVAESGRTVVAADRCRLALWDDDRDGPVGPGPVLDTLDGRSGPAAVGRSGSSAGYSATAPLRDAGGRVLGVLSFDWSGDAAPSAARTAGLDAMVKVCSRALRRAIAHDAQAALIRALRRELLPAMPAVTGVDLSARCLSADDRLAFGGDWYDAIPIDPARTALVIGDMVGHGVQAAARMARVRGVLNALIQVDPDLGSLFDRAFDLLACLQDPFIGTAAVFVIDTAADVLTFAAAGHPPALLRRPDGSVAMLTEGHGPALGLPPRTIRPGRVPFGPGSTLLAYTDGLVERRRHDLDAGIQTITDVLAEGCSAPSVSAAAVLDRVLGATGVRAHRRDDVAVVVVRRTAR